MLEQFEKAWHQEGRLQKQEILELLQPLRLQVLLVAVQQLLQYDWNTFVSDFKQRFLPSRFLIDLEDEFVALMQKDIPMVTYSIGKLLTLTQQIGTPEKKKLQAFISGLDSSIKYSIQNLNPKIYEEALALAQNKINKGAALSASAHPFCDPSWFLPVRVKKMPKESNLDYRVAQFIRCICDATIMKQQVLSLGYDANKLPLSDLTKATILKVMSHQPFELSREFYTILPHNCKAEDINNVSKLKQKLKMLDALDEVQMAMAFLEHCDEQIIQQLMLLINV
ncbi:hypothetical protein GOP47_0029421 [Adiantum capillus-veneris]|nr:hypothetical protein GOP47_0029421 [Adiantum capillus-veneris]